MSSTETTKHPARSPSPSDGLLSAPALFLDLDGTVRRTKSGRVHPIKPWDQELLPGVLNGLQTWKRHGYHIVGVTNQGGVAYGYFTEADVQAINRRLSEELAQGLFDVIYYCPHHPLGRNGYAQACACRKPEPGMAHMARRDLNVDLPRSVMVGDMDTDRLFALRAGIGRFYWVTEFFDPTNPNGVAIEP